MKRILCYGDSNTWGYIPISGLRYQKYLRWPGLLQKYLGNNYKIIEEGLNGRTTSLDDPYEPSRNGLSSLPSIIKTHIPIDQIIIMLGTNDLKSYFNPRVEDISQGISDLVNVSHQTLLDINKTQKPEVYIISPIWIYEIPKVQGELFKGATMKSRLLSRSLQTVADHHGCQFLNAALVANPSLSDGVHLDIFGHTRLAKAILRSIL